MKVQLQPSKSSRGAALLITAVVIGILGITMATYLILTQSEYTSVARSQNWNGSLVLAEAGVEDALGMINTYATTATAISNWVNRAGSDGWTVGSTNIGGVPTGVYTISRTVDANFGSYSVSIVNLYGGTNYTPQITSIGSAKWDLTPLPGASRRIYVQTTPNSRFSGGILAETTMDFNGNDVLVDSYDSSDPTKSFWRTNMTYRGHNYGTYTNTLRTADAVVGTDGTIINVGNADIYGYVNTGPGGAVSINANGSVGDTTWVPTPGVQPGHEKNDMNVTWLLPPLPSPTNGWNAVTRPPGGTTNIGGVAYTWWIVNNPAKADIGGLVYYAMDSLTKNNDRNLYVNATNAVLYLTNGLAYNRSSDTLTVNTNCDITIYTGGNFSVGNGIVNNFAQYGPAFSINGLSGCTGINFGGNATLTAAIYAPNAYVQFNGGGNSNNGQYDVAGSIVCLKVQVNGHYNFHFDVELKRNIPPDKYVPIVWQELAPSGNTLQ